MYAATKSTMWRVCYLIQGSFDGGDPNEFHRYAFLFPDNADRVTVTLSVGKPPQSNGRFRYRLIKSGTKITNAQPARAIGQLPVYSTYKATYDVRRGGKGEWTFEINPDFGRIVAGIRVPQLRLRYHRRKRQESGCLFAHFKMDEDGTGRGGQGAGRGGQKTG